MILETPSRRQDLLAAVVEYRIEGVTKRDSTARLKEKVGKWIDDQLLARQRRKTIRRRKLLLGGTAALAVMSAVVIPFSSSVASTSFIPLEATTFEDEEIRQFVTKWCSPRRQHVATLVVAGRPLAVTKILDDIERLARADVLRRKDFDRHAFRTFAMEKVGWRLAIFDDDTTPPLSAEALTDPYRIDPKLSTAAAIFALQNEDFCSSSGRRDPRTIFKERFGNALPPAFHNRIQHAALVC